MMGNSPFKDAVEVLKSIRDFCEKRENQWQHLPRRAPNQTANEIRYLRDVNYDLKLIREKADRAIKELTPTCPGRDEDR